MNPIYKFELATEYNGVTNNYAVYPLFKSDLAKDYELQQNERFFRAKLNGKLTFSRNDYVTIANANFETRFVLVVSISWDNGQTWAEYWRGEFWKTDCKFDADAQTIDVTPSPVDGYTEVLAGMEKEYNLIDLKPEIERVRLWKRPLIQMYVPGETVVSCFLSGMYWEQDCRAIENEDELKNTYHFTLNAQRRLMDVIGETTPELPLSFNGIVPENETTPFNYTRGEFTLSFEYISGSGYAAGIWTISHNGTMLWRGQIVNQPMPIAPYYITLEPVDGTGATGNVTLYAHDVHVFGRYLLDVEELRGVATQPIPDDDLVENNRNYHRVIGYAVNDVIRFSDEATTTPTEWGMKTPGQYYVKPYSIFGQQMYPIGRSHWGDVSIWFAFSTFDWLYEESGRKEYTINDVNPLFSVISVLLAKIAPGITHEPTAEYSQFLYGRYNPISGNKFELALTQKSNILVGEYTEPTRNAPITLKMVTDMLRDCFRAYWFIEDGKFKVEHVQWFKNGGRYTGNPVISHDLTIESVTRNAKAWAFGTSQYEYNKPTMPERYQFGWMDETTRAFDGFPIEIISKFVNPGNIEQITVSNFTTDIDYMLLNPAACSKDGFALMATMADDVITPDTEYMIVTGRLIPWLYGLRYSLGGMAAGETITIDFSAKPYEDGGEDGACDIVFLRENNSPISTMGTFEHSGQHRFYGTVPPEATQIGFRAKTDIVMMVKVSAINGERYLPFITHEINREETRNQNGLLAFVDLQPKYYIYDLPAYNVRINEQQDVAYGITREKKQTLRFPVVDDPNPMQLIKTHLGNGQVDKISVNLSSRITNVTLAFDTQNYDE